MTPRTKIGSSIVAVAICPLISLACGSPSEAEPTAAPTPAPAVSKEAAPIAGEVCLGTGDKGIWSDLDDRIQITLPAHLTKDRVSARVDEAHHVLVLSIDSFPRKTYPLGGPATLAVGSFQLALRPGDKAELARLLVADRVTAGRARHDRDDDGIPDPLDILVGAKKTVVNADAYGGDYMTLKYPGGDVPRTMGVCTDVVIRAVRNAGIDIQKELHEDIARARRAYPMVKGNGDPSIDQRRVKTLLPYFQRHWEAHTTRFDDPADPLRPGDVIFMDTFPSKPGPDHIGILSDTLDDQGLPMVINNWTDGTVTKEMDLLTFVPVLYRFRLPE
jgi:hypothetical protein